MFNQAALDQDVGKDHERQKGGNQSEKPQVQSHFCTFKDQTREKQQNHKQGSTKKRRKERFHKKFLFLRIVCINSKTYAYKNKTAFVRGASDEEKATG